VTSLPTGLAWGAVCVALFATLGLLTTRCSHCLVGFVFVELVVVVVASHFSRTLLAWEETTWSQHHHEHECQTEDEEAIRCERVRREEFTQTTKERRPVRHFFAERVNRAGEF